MATAEVSLTMTIDIPSTCNTQRMSESHLTNDTKTNDPSDQKNSVCHVVPCHICYTGPAPNMDVYFNPVPITTTTTTTTTTRIDSLMETKELQKANTQQNEQYQAVMLRGRGLLAKSAIPVKGHVFQVVKSTSNQNEPNQFERVSSSPSYRQKEPQKYLRSIQTFDKYVEWFHESSPNAIPPTSSSRLSRAIEWMNIADCLHVPLPLPSQPVATTTIEKDIDVGTN